MESGHYRRSCSGNKKLGGNLKISPQDVLISQVLDLPGCDMGCPPANVV